MATGVLANDTDPDGDVLRTFVVTYPAHGQLYLLGDGLKVLIAMGLLPGAWRLAGRGER